MCFFHAVLAEPSKHKFVVPVRQRATNNGQKDETQREKEKGKAMRRSRKRAPTEYLFKCVFN